MWNNETLRAILEQWHIAQIPQAEWDAKKLNIKASEGWHKIHALVLFMSTDTAKGSKIGGQWQQAIIDDLLKPLTSLMQGGYIPTVKIYILSNWDWYRAYSTDAGWTPGARLASGQVAGLGLTRVWGQGADGLKTEVPMAAPYATLTEVWQNMPSDDYSYPLSLDGIDFQFFVFSFNRLRAINMFYKDATVTPVTCGYFCDTEPNFLGAAQPPVVPPVDTDLIKAINAVRDELKADAETNRRIIMQELLSLRARIDNIYK